MRALFTSARFLFEFLAYGIRHVQVSLHILHKSITIHSEFIIKLQGENLCRKKQKKKSY